MIDFAPRFRRPAKLPALRVSPYLARESFILPVALIALTCVSAIAIVNRLRPDDRFQAPGLTTPDFASYLSDLTGAPVPASLATVWTDKALSRHARSVRVGARIVDLEVTARARDMVSSAALVNQDSAYIVKHAEQSVIAARYAGDIAAMLDQAKGLKYLADHFRRIQHLAGEPAALGGEVRHLRRIAVADDAAYLLLGDWLEAARIAALREDRTFFATRPSLTQVERLTDMDGLDDAERAAVARVKGLLPSGHVDSFAALRSGLDAALATVAR